MGLFDRLKKKKKEEKVSGKEAKIEIEKKVEGKKEIGLEPAVEPTNKKSGKETIPTVLLKPLISEKAARGEAGGAYTFIVNRDAGKFDIKRSVKEAYGVEPKKVRIINIEGKRVYFGQKPGKRSDWKKALVTLPKGKTISIHEGV